ncbi:hypothetical protein [Streptomyces sp. NPDC017520]|uniref:hypothetical protein n=1 Tax=Streptomyces sp. NPDC017520 TaxID=3364998 RepID=UPI003790DFDD
MNGQIIPRDQAIAAARAVLDRARVRIARDRAAGRLSSEHELILRRIERDQRRRAAARQSARPTAA